MEAGENDFCDLSIAVGLLNLYCKQVCCDDYQNRTKNFKLEEIEFSLLSVKSRIKGVFKKSSKSDHRIYNRALEKIDPSKNRFLENRFLENRSVENKTKTTQIRG